MARRLEVWLPLAYAGLAGAWIAFSDLLVVAAAPSAGHAAGLSLAKGLAFVVVTAAGLAGVLSWSMRRLRRAEHELRASEERLRGSLDEAMAAAQRATATARHAEALADASRDAIFFIRARDLLILDANRAAEEAYGWSREELRRMTVHGLRADPPSPEVEAKLRSPALAGLLFETVHMRRDGTTFPVEVNSRAAEVDGERAIVSVVRDLTARRAAEAERERSAYELRSILETALDGFSVTGPDGRYLVVNDAYTAISGYSREELLALRFQDLAVDLTPEAVEGFRRRIEAVGWARFESRHRRKDGSTVDLEISVRASTTSPGCFNTFIRDITARKAAEEALRLNEARFRTIIEKASDMTLVVDGEARVVFWSPSAAQTLGWTSAELEGTSPANLIHPEDRRKVAEAILALLARPGGSAPVGARFQRKDGEWRILDGLVRNLLDDPAVCGLVVNFRDVSEVRTLEERLHQSQKLESIGRLAGGVAHDFNNLLTVILSCAEGIREAVDAGSAPVREDVEEIQSAGRRATDLTRQLLAFARKQVVAPAVLDLGEIVRGGERLLRRILGEDVVLSVSTAPGLWSVRCDPGQLEQVILNLALNARDAMPGGGRLAVAVDNRRVDDRAAAAHPGLLPGDYVRLAFADSGVGLTGEVKAHLFEPFFTTKAPGKGTGLGLATVYGIVRQAGGAVVVESEEGRGARFEVLLPRCDGAVAVEAPPPPGGARRGSETVLVVEDEPLVRGVTARALAGAGYRVLVAAGGDEALDVAARADRLDLLVTDVIMPGQSGRAVADALRAARPGLPVLFVSGYPRDAISRAGVLDSGIEFLSKPFTAAGLQERVRRVLDAAASQSRSL